MQRLERVRIVSQMHASEGCFWVFVGVEKNTSTSCQRVLRLPSLLFYLNKIILIEPNLCFFTCFWLDKKNKYASFHWS